MSIVAGAGVSVISRASPAESWTGRTASSSGAAGGPARVVVTAGVVVEAIAVVVLGVVVGPVVVAAVSSSPAQAASTGRTPSAVKPSVNASRRVHVPAPSAVTLHHVADGD